jgi:hypothetical protein
MASPFEDQLLASAVQFLIDGGEEQAASLLLRCDLTITDAELFFEMGGDSQAEGLTLELSAPRADYDLLLDVDNPITQAIRQAFDAVMPGNNFVRYFAAKAALVTISPNWRDDLRTSVHNQGVAVKPGRLWENLRFNNESELRIAKALDQAGVLYFPLCKGRLGPAAARQNREPDFLICQNGKWGVLEVDGDLSHPSSRTYQDHERDRLFHRYGVRVVHHYHALKCHDAPQAVAKDFLDLLERNG